MSGKFQFQPGGLQMPGAPRLKHHPLAELFPMLAEEHRASFRASLAEQQNHPIVLHRGAILDGRNRERELFELGKPISFVVFVGTERQAFDFVMAENLERRHLTESQRAMVAAKVATLKLGANQHSAPPIGGPSLFEVPDPDGTAAAAESAATSISQTEAADMMNVSRRSVQSATKVQEKGVPELQQAVERDQIAVSVAEKIARLPEAEQPAALEKALPNGNRAIMSSRQEPDSSLDFFPTPPWATRALIEWVFPRFALVLPELSIWEPACGEGHMAEVAREYSPDVLATDVFDYGYGDATLDFLSDLMVGDATKDFIITNPPFGDKGEAFVLQALKHAEVGVAMFVRLQWLETIGRYENIFKDHPPTLIAFFAERVNLCKGRWDPEGGTATAYIWLVWIKGEQPRAPFWIPPGCREALTRPDDAARFTQRPVQKKQASLDIDSAEEAAA